MRGEAVLGALRALGPVATEDELRQHAAGWRAGVVHGLGLEVPWTGDWRMTGPSPLWRYHLHYHDHLAALAWVAGTDADDDAAHALTDALAAWDLAWHGGGAPAWDAYPVSVRLVNWLRILAWAGDRIPPPARTLLQRGIGRHAAHLAAQLEWHLDANHLLRDAWALGLAALACERAAGPPDLFARILAEQVGPDGWHEERSPMYHARALRDALELEAAAAAVERPLDPATRERIRAMRDAMPWMRRGDGSLWTLNDAAQDLGVDLAALSGAAAPPAGLRHFDAAAITVLIDAATGDRLRIDRGGPAPAHQPAHAHAGALGFEWDVAGIPCLVDRGCSGYDGDPWREHLRGTAAHNTIRVGERDQSEMWATFRIGGRARVRTLDRRLADGNGSGDLSLTAECRGWSTPDARHERTFTREGRTITVADRVEHARGRAVIGHLHCAPDWSVERAGDRALLLRHARATVHCTIEGDATITLHRGERSPDAGWHAHGFGNVVPAWTIRFTAPANAAAPAWRTILAPT
jgi:uncharacterized heparinase superfamily protein